MNSTSDPVKLYTDKSESYSRFIRLLRYPQGIHAYFYRSPLLRSKLRVLDAGCGTGIILLALRHALLRRGFDLGILLGFDLTPKMLRDFRQTLEMREIEGVKLTQADVLDLGTLPSGWNNFDLIVSAAMLEYVPRESLVEALSSLRTHLSETGSILVFITRSNWLTRPLIGRWWQANLYEAVELEKSFRLAGFSTIEFGEFPHPYRYLSLWGHVIEAK